MIKKTKEELLQKELLDMLTPDKDKMKIGNKVFISLEEVEKILNKLGENRNRSNSLVSITIGDSFTTNSVEMLKEELKKRLGIK